MKPRIKSNRVVASSDLKNVGKRKKVKPLKTKKTWNKKSLKY